MAAASNPVARRRSSPGFAMVLGTLRHIAILAAAVAVLWALPADCPAWQRKGPKKAVPPGPSDVPPTKRAKPAAREPDDFRSTHFLLHTDLAPQDAKDLLERLETMLGLISKYWGQPSAGVIECYVVKDLGAWPADSLDAAGRAKIAQGAGITHVDTISRGTTTLAARAVVYATSEHGTPQHEAVHAYCGQTFGRTGPLWYSEGMAEMGQYWRQGDSSVQCPKYVIDYIRKSEPKPLGEILSEEGGSAAGPAQTGDSWQNYAWRWALCHLLVNNPNYSDRFRPLGLGYLNGARVSFAETYGAMAPEIEFEYRFFLAHVEQGYRVDLCRWDWDHKFKRPAVGAATRARIVANRGWQPSGALLRSGQTYQYHASGAWQISPEHRDVTASGTKDGAGRLEGIIFRDFTLGEPFALSAGGSFVAPSDGRLYLRCRDQWNALADNTGFVAVKIEQSPQKPPGPADAK